MYPTASLRATASKVLTLSLAALGLTGVSTARAQTLLSSESFGDAGYTVGTELQTKTNSLTSPAVAGYTGNWTDPAVDGWGDLNAKIISGSLEYNDANYATASGNSVGVVANTNVGGSGRVYRLFDSSLTVTNSTTGTLYMSFLFQTASTTGYQNLELYDGWATSGNSDALRNFQLGINGSGGTRFAVDNNNANGSVLTTSTAVNLYVVKFDLSATAASDSVTVWLNPTLGSGDASGGVVISGMDVTFDRLSLSDYAGGAAAWDELRWGTSFDTVTVSASAIPEPSTYAAILGAAALGFVAFRRRKSAV